MRGIMGKPSTIFMLFSMVLALFGAHGAGAPTLTEMTRSMDQWFKSLNQDKLTLTKLQVYIQATFAVSKNQTVFEVAKSEITSKSPSNFGSAIVIDNALTAGPDPGSRNLGSYQGMNTFADFNIVAANMNMNMVLNDYNGSTVTVLGRQPVPEKIRVLSIVGGTGVFRFAKGIVLASTYSTDPVAKTGTYLYVMYIVTPAAGKGGEVKTA